MSQPEPPAKAPRKIPEKKKCIECQELKLPNAFVTGFTSCTKCRNKVVHPVYGEGAQMTVRGASQSHHVFGAQPLGTPGLAGWSQTSLGVGKHDTTDSVALQIRELDLLPQTSRDEIESRGMHEEQKDHPQVEALQSQLQAAVSSSKECLQAQTEIKLSMETYGDGVATMLQQISSSLESLKDEVRTLRLQSDQVEEQCQSLRERVHAQEKENQTLRGQIQWRSQEERIQQLEIENQKYLSQLQALLPPLETKSPELVRPNVSGPLIPSTPQRVSGDPHSARSPTLALRGERDTRSSGAEPFRVSEEEAREAGTIESLTGGPAATTEAEAPGVQTPGPRSLSALIGAPPPIDTPHRTPPRMGGPSLKPPAVKLSSR